MLQHTLNAISFKGRIGININFVDQKVCIGLIFELNNAEYFAWPKPNFIFLFHIDLYHDILIATNTSCTYIGQYAALNALSFFNLSPDYFWLVPTPSSHKSTYLLVMVHFCSREKTHEASVSPFKIAKKNGARSLFCRPSRTGAWGLFFSFVNISTGVATVSMGSIWHWTMYAKHMSGITYTKGTYGMRVSHFPHGHLGNTILCYTNTPRNMSRKWPGFILL